MPSAAPSIPRVSAPARCLGGRGVSVEVKPVPFRRRARIHIDIGSNTMIEHANSYSYSILDSLLHQWVEDRICFLERRWPERFLRQIEIYWNSMHGQRLQCIVDPSLVGIIRFGFLAQLA